MLKIVFYIVSACLVVSLGMCGFIMNRNFFRSGKKPFDRNPFGAKVPYNLGVVTIVVIIIWGLLNFVI